MDNGVKPSGIISPPIDCESFEVGGIVYTKTDTLSLGREQWLQRFQSELHFDMHIPAVQKALAEIYAAYNSGRNVDGAVALKRLMDGTDVLGRNRVRQAEIVALFYVAPDEDPADNDYEKLKQKVYTAWRAVDRDFFIVSAFSLLLTSSKRYPSLSEIAESLGPAPSPTSEPLQPA